MGDKELVQECIDTFKEAKTRSKFLAAEVEEKEQLIKKKTRQADNFIKARWVLSEVARLTQEQFKDRVESLVTMAVQSVFDRPFGFELIFERKRNKLECKPVVYEMVGNNKVMYEDPKDDVGGSAIDIISFALRIVLWHLEKPSSRNVILLDEPMKNMGRLVGLGGQVLREISHRLNLQLIIVTHDVSLMEIGDRVYEVKHNGIYSEVTRKEVLDKEGMVKFIDVDKKPKLLRRSTNL